MIKYDYFVINGKKTLIFRREPMFSASDEWVVFDPYDLEFYSMNTIAAEIFFLISQGKSDAEAYLLLAQKYEMSFEQFKIFKSTLIECSPFYKAIFVNDLINNS